MRCAGALAMEAPFPESHSKHADEGTAAHTLGALALTNNKNARDYLGEVIRVEHDDGAPSSDWVVGTDMAKDTQVYINLVRELAEHGTLLVEQRVDFSPFVALDEQTGTADAVIISEDGLHLTVVDLKFGRGVEVDAVENEQLQLYALGCLNTFGMLCAFEVVRMIISQPRINVEPSEWVRTVAELRAFGDKAMETSEQAVAMLEHKAGDPLLVEQLTPGAKQCLWCKAKATCPALIAAVSETVTGDFDVLADPEADPVPINPESQDAERLDTLMLRLEIVETWTKAVRAEVERRLLGGEKLPSWKLVEGRRGARAWTDEPMVEKLLKSFRLKEAEMYDFKLISPTKAEKVLESNPKRWDKVAALVGQSAGKPSVAHISDKRREFTPTSAADFDTISD